MNYENFKISAISAIQKKFGESADVSLQPVVKNNDVRLDGLTILSDSANVSPTIYLNQHYQDYQNGKPLPDIVDDIVKTYTENLPEAQMDFSFFTDFDQIRYKIIYKLVHFEKNKSLLSDVPHFRYLDLAIVFCCFLPDTPGGNAAILIQNHHLGFWNATKEDLYGLAVKNTPMLLPYEIKSMEDTLKTLCPELFSNELSADCPSEIPAMYVLTNSAKLYGASVLLYPGVLSEFASQIQSDLYILPSSIHEVLLLPKALQSNASDLDFMIQDVNASHVSEEDVLSDHAYLFERERGFLTL